MKHLIYLLLLLPAMVFAETYYVRADKIATGIDDSVIYETNAGVIIKAQPGCKTPENQLMRLDYNAVPYYGSIGGGNYDRLSYTDTEPFINDGELDEREIVKSCLVYGVIGLQAITNPSIDSNVIFDRENLILYIKNVPVYDGPYQSGEFFELAIFKYQDNEIRLIEFVE